MESRRLLAAGALDLSFSGDGKTTVDFGLTVSTDVAVQADGKTIVVGTFDRPVSGTQAPQSDFAVARFNLDGSLDRSFNANTAHPGLAFAHPGKTGSFDEAHAVAIQGDGKIVVGGGSHVDSFGFDTFQFAVVRFNPDGFHDGSFSGNGVRNIELGGFASASDVVVQADGKIVVVGLSDEDGDDDLDIFDYAMVRLNPNGDLDESFNSDGKKTIFVSGADGANAVAIDSAGNYVLVGASDSGSQTTLSAVRVKREGPLDTTFDTDGRLLLPLTGHTHVEARGVLVQSDNKIIVVGRSIGTNDRHMFMLRLNVDGKIDTTFGSNGTGVVETPGMDAATSIIRSADGGLIVGGGVGGSGGEIGESFVLAGYDANGVLKTSFGTAGTGLVITDFGDGQAAVFGLAKGPGRRFVATGGPLAHTARYLDTGANVVSAGVFDGLAGEGTTNTGLLAVGRLDRLPVPTRVYITIGGTATGRGLIGTRDYTMDRMVVPVVIVGGDSRPYVDIPANETFVFVTLTTRNDTRIEGSESATFTIMPDPSYEIGTPRTGTVTITDDDRLSFTIGTTTVTPPPKHVEEGQEVQTAVTWTVPSGGWRQLSSIQLRLRDLDDDDALVLLSFDEATNSFSQDATAAGDGRVSLVPIKSTFSAAGPTAPTVTVTFTYRFTAAAAGRRFAVDVSADNDAGDASGFSTVDKIFVRKKAKRHEPFLISDAL